ncbi:MAG: hypothetical protein WAV13_10010 [Thermodesulfovibrionales bacterium]
MFLTVFLLPTLLFFTSTPALGQPLNFTPKITNYRGDMELEFFDETYKDKFGPSQQKRSETAFITKIILTASGFVYHPRFIVFRVSLTGGLMQGQFDYSTINQDGSWDTDTAFGYDFRMVALPEHPYNLEIHSTRTSIVSRGSLRAGEIPVAYDHGIYLQYKKKPYFGSMGYNHIKSESFQTETEGDKFSTAAGYIADIMNTNASFTYTDSSLSSRGYSADNETGVLNFFNRIGGQHSSFTTKLDMIKYRQTASDDSFLNTDRLVLDQLLDLDLPANFRSEFRHRYSKYDSETEKGKDSSSTDTANFRISHRLFRSLETTYSFDYSKMEFDSADSKRLSHLFTLIYYKQIPWGNMQAGLNLGWADTERSGTVSIFHEVHSAPLLSDFVLRSSNISEVLSIDVKDPATGFFIQLQEGDYRVTQIGTMTIITVLSVPSIVVNVNPLFAYEFQVSYEIVPEELTVEERTYGYHLNMSLFDGMVSPYYSHTVFKQELVSGSLGNNPTKRTTDTIGVTLLKMPFTLKLDYQESESDFESTKKFKLDLLFDQAVSRTLTVFGTANYYNDEYESFGTSHEFTETGGGLGFRKEFTRMRMNFSSSAHYAHRSGDSDGYSYYFNSALSWNIRSTNIALGATISYGETESNFSNADSFKSERDYKYFYLKARRQLF